jgi:hypothetical protein
MRQSERIRRIVEYRFPAWLAALVVLGLVIVIKFVTG